MGDRPWMKFYPRDWRGDQALRAVSMAARGFWLECMCIMHEAKPYGQLLLNGSPIENDVLARMTGATVDEVSGWMSELAAAGVLSVTRNGIVFSRRMMRDEASSKKGAEAVKRRWSNTTENKQENTRPNRLPKEDLIPRSQKPEYREEDSSLRSLSHSSENDLFEQTGNGTGNQLVPIAKPAADPQGDHARFVEFWQTYPKRLGTNSRKEASAKFTRAVKAGTDPAEIIAGAARYAAHCDETGKTSTDKVQQATTWLNQANWETDYGRQQLNNRQQSNGRPIQGNPVLANAITRLEERRLRFTDPETGTYDSRAADAFGEAERDRIRAQFYPNTFGRG